MPERARLIAENPSLVSPMPFGWVGFDAFHKDYEITGEVYDVSNAFRLGGL